PGVGNLGVDAAQVEVPHPGAQDDGDAGDRREPAPQGGGGPGDQGLLLRVHRQVAMANITPSKTSLPLTTAWLSHFRPRRDSSFSFETMKTRSPGRTAPRKRTSSMPANTTSFSMISGMNFFQATRETWAAASTRMTPGRMGFPGKWPETQNSFFPTS